MNEIDINGGTESRSWPDVLQREVARVQRLREDVLLLRFHMARRTDVADKIDPTDRLSSETALKSSLEVLESIERHEIPATGYIAATAASLMHAVDRLVHATRLARVKDGTNGTPFPVTPESLRASLPAADIAYALGKKPPENRRRTAYEAKRYLFGKFRATLSWFFVALLVHGAAMLFFDKSNARLFSGTLYVDALMNVLSDFYIPLSGFLWALVGSYVWILMRFRRFGSAYAFDPAHAEVFVARVFSGSVTTAVLLYFVFGGTEPWATSWKVGLPLWGFTMGYAGKLQVELLRTFVERIQGQIVSFSRAGNDSNPVPVTPNPTTTADEQEVSDIPPPQTGEPPYVARQDGPGQSDEPKGS